MTMKKTTSPFKINIQNASQYRFGSSVIPKRALIQTWVNTVLLNRIDSAEIGVRLVDEKESASLNETYRHHSGPTNVLSFPYDIPKNIAHAIKQPRPLLGDVVMCASIIAREAKKQNKTLAAHWAHIVTHGVLHLLGYDHIKEKEANVMEGLETEILTMQLGFPDPYGHL